MMLYGYLAWLAAIGLVGAVLSLYDKWAAKHNPRHRIREKTLLRLGALGGAFLMLPTMQLIRHKTKHKQILWTLRLSLLVHLLIIGFLLYREGSFDWLIQRF